MSMLSAEMLAEMRATVLEMLPDTAVLMTASGSVDNAGAWQPGYSAAGTVPCRIDPATPGRSEIELFANRKDLKVFYRLTVPYNAGIAAGMRVSISSDDYEILELYAEHSWNVSRRAYIGRR